MGNETIRDTFSRTTQCRTLPHHHEGNSINTDYQVPFHIDSSEGHILRADFEVTPR